MGNAVSDAIGSDIDIEGHNLQIVKLLAEGAFSYVFLATSNRNGRKYAVKRLLAQDKSSEAVIRKEIEIMKANPVEEFVRYYGSSVRQDGRDKEFFLLLEYCPNGSLFDFIQEHQPTPLHESVLLSQFSMIARGVERLHSSNPPICHRDLKLENILRGATGMLKLCDFGSCTTQAKVYDNPEDIAAQQVVIRKYSTGSYRAPEMINLFRRVRIDEKVDIWSMGIIFYMLAFYTHPFPDGSNLQISSAKFKIPENHPYSPQIVQIISRMIQKNPEKRPSCEQILTYVAYVSQGGTDKFSSFLKPLKRSKKKTVKAHTPRLPQDEEFDSFDADFTTMFDSSQGPQQQNSDVFDLIGISRENGPRESNSEFLGEFAEAKRSDQHEEDLLGLFTLVPNDSADIQANMQEVQTSTRADTGSHKRTTWEQF